MLYSFRQVIDGQAMFDAKVRWRIGHNLGHGCKSSGFDTLGQDVSTSSVAKLDECPQSAGTGVSRLNWFAN
jgi:hypothetical protein